MKQQHLALSVLVLLAISIYHAWFFSFGIISNGDRGYLPDLLNGHHALYIWRSVMNFGDVVIDLGQWSWQLFPLLGRLGITYQLAERIIFLWPSVLCATIGFFLLGNRIWKSTWAGVATSLVFCYSTYFLTLQTGHTTLAAGFSIFAFVWLAYDSFLETQKVSWGIASLVLFSLCLGYEPRAGYIMAGVLALTTLFWYFRTKHERKKMMRYMLVGAGIIVALNLWRYLPLSHSLGDITDNELFNRGLFGNDFFDILYAFALYHPRRDGIVNKAFVNQPIPLYFWLLPLTAWRGFFVQRKERTMQFFAVLALLGIFLSKQVAPPGGFVYKLLFDHFPGFSAFREASKFYVLIAMSYSVMIGGLFARLWKQKKLRIGFWCMMSLLVVFSLRNTRSYITGDIGALFVIKHPSQDYERLNNFLREQKGFARTLAVPKYSRRTRYDKNTPRISLAEELRKLSYAGYTGATTYAKIHSLFQLSGTDAMIDNLAVRYIILPMKDDANQDNVYTYYGREDYEKALPRSLTGEARKEKVHAISLQARQDYYELLQGLPYLHEVDLGMQDGTHLFENIGYAPLIHASSGSVKFSRVNPTFYELDITVPTGVTGVKLSFMQRYNQGRDLFPRTQPIICNTPYVTSGTILRGPVTECVQSKYTFLPPDILQYRYSPAVKGVSHIKDAGLAQSWEIGVTPHTGDVVLRYNLVFRPQSLLYIGLMISGGATLLLVLLGLGSWWREKRSLKK